MHSLSALAGVLVLLHAPLHGGDGTLAFFEDFDSLTPPAIPQGWTSSQNRSPGINDFTTTASSPLSLPNALISTNATIDQFIVSPPVDFHNTSPESIAFSTRRSSSHLAAVVLEVSLDDGRTFPIVLGDTLLNPGSSNYVRNYVALPETLSLSSAARFRWRVVGASSGSTGTFRIDEVLITTRVQDDLAVSRISVSPPLAGTSDPLLVTSHIINTGLRPAEGFEAGIFLDDNRDSVASPEEQRASLFIPEPVNPGDSVAAGFSLSPLKAGTHILIATVRSSHDNNPDNDSLIAQATIRYPANSLVINEILFEPLPGEGEYLELFNTGPDSIDLHGWLVRDRPGSSGTANEFLVTGLARPCPPGGFLLLAEDSSLLRSYPSLATEEGVFVLLTGGSPSLNNDGDAIILCDPAGAIIDSVPYLPSWHHPEVIDATGRSLEKVNPLLRGSDARSWSTTAAPEGGTPGRQNSLYSTVPRANSTLSFSPNPFSPDGDGMDDMTIIRYETPAGASTFSVQIFDIDGRIIRRLATNELTGPTGSIVWDGLDDQRRKARIGMYVVYLEIFGRTGEVLGARKAVVVLAGRL